MRMLKKLFEPCPISMLVIIIIPIAIILLLTAITQYVVFFSVKPGTSMLWLALIGLVIGVILGFKFRLNKPRAVALAVAVVVGFVLVPYSSFAFGQIHVFMKDDDVPDNVRAIEVRVTLDKIVWNEKNSGGIHSFIYSWVCSGGFCFRLCPADPEFDFWF